MPRYALKLRLEFESDDPTTAERVLKEFIAEGLSNLHYNGTLDPSAHWVVTTDPPREIKGRKKRCPRCKGAGAVPGHRRYPGTHAYRPPAPCDSCKGTGVVRVYRGHQGLDEHRQALARNGQRPEGEHAG